jgi:hypothetical protein
MPEFIGGKRKKERKRDVRDTLKIQKTTCVTKGSRGGQDKLNSKVK